MIYTMSAMYRKTFVWKFNKEAKISGNQLGQLLSGAHPASGTVTRYTKFGSPPPQKSVTSGVTSEDFVQIHTEYLDTEYLNYWKWIL